jgi:probable HAF family extracellular repeat protein
MNRIITHALAVCSSSVLLAAIGPLPCYACGGDSLTIKSLPDSDSTSYQVYALGPNGQVVGFSTKPGVHGPLGFIYADGTINDLGTLGGPSSFAYSVNAAGQVTGEADRDASGISHAFLLSEASMADLGTLGGTSSRGFLINDAGQVAGESDLPGNEAPTAWLYANGVMASLGTLGSNYSTPFGLNNQGVVVGESGLLNGEVHGFVYSNQAMQDLGTLGGDYSSAFAVSESHVVVGESSLANGEVHAFAWSAGNLKDLGSLGGTYASAFLIDQNGQIAGNGTIADDTAMHGFVYAAGVMQDLGTLGGDTCSIWAMNNAGEIVGESATAEHKTHAFLWKNGKLRDLNELLPANSGWELVRAQFINDTGRIVGYGYHDAAFRWFVMDPAGGNTAPVAVAGPDQTVDCQAQVTLDGSASHDPDNDALTFAWTSNGATLGTEPTLTVSLPLGTNVVTLTVTDACGTSSSADVTVTVADTIPPTGSCPSGVNAVAGVDCQATVPNLVSQIVASDNCTPKESLIVTQDPAAGTIVGSGNHTIFLTVKDSSGNRSTCTVPFTVADKTAPLIAGAPGLVTVVAGPDCLALVPNVLAKVTAADNCTPANQIVLRQNPAVGTSVGSGSYSVVITATDASGNSSTATVSLKVSDVTAPTILSLPSAFTVATTGNCHGIVPNVASSVVATDNCTPADQLAITQSPAAGTPLPPGQSSITVTVTDKAGNSASGDVLVSAIDSAAPVFQSLTASPNVLNPPNHQLVPVIFSAQVSDDCSGVKLTKILSITSNETVSPGDIQITGNLSALLAASRNPSGGGRVYTVTVQATDAQNNSSTAVVTVAVPQGNGNGNTAAATVRKK